MVSVPRVEAAQAMPAARLNQPFAIDDATYDSGSDTLTVKVANGRVRFGGTTFELADATTYDTDVTQTPVAASTTYYLYLDYNGGAPALVLTTTAPASVDADHTLLGSVTTDGAKSVASTTDDRGLFVPVAPRVPFGSVAVPAIAFDGDPNTGMYRSATDTIGFAAGGTLGLSVSASDVNAPTKVTTPLVQGPNSLALNAPAGDILLRTAGVTRGYYDDSIDSWRFLSGTSEKLRVDATGVLALADIRPASDVTYDLGTSALHFANAYINVVTLKGGQSASDKVMDFTKPGWGLWVDSTGSGGSVGRWWLDAPHGGEIVLGPRSGADFLNRLRVRGATVQEGNLSPSPDNSRQLGSSGSRWTEVWAVDGSINTSDVRGKVDVTPSDLGLDFLRAVGSSRWRRRDGGRPHYGPIAQKVKAAMDQFGVDFAGYVDPNIAPPTQEQEPNLYDDDGNYVADLPLGLRPHEFIGPIITALTEIDDRLLALENA